MIDNMSDIFGEGLDTLMKGLSNLVPSDDPTFQYLTAKGKLVELNHKADNLYIQIGKMAMSRDGADAYGETATQLQAVLNEIAEAQSIIDKAGTTADSTETFNDMCASKAADLCPNCGHANPSDAKFCNDCGAKLGPMDCPDCGATNPAGTKFCGQCGAKL